LTYTNIKRLELRSHFIVVFFCCIFFRYHCFSL